MCGLGVAVGCKSGHKKRLMCGAGWLLAAGWSLEGFRAIRSDGCVARGGCWLQGEVWRVLGLANGRSYWCGLMAARWVWPWKAKKEKSHTCGGPRRRPCLGQGRGRRIFVGPNRCNVGHPITKLPLGMVYDTALTTLPPGVFFNNRDVSIINGNSRILNWRYLPYIRPI